MSIFDDMLSSQLAFFMQLKEDDWVQWIAIPNMWEDDCDKLDGCYFIKRNLPPYPQHANCRCRLVKISKPIPWETAFAQGDIRKFSEYIFNPANSKGKTALFFAMGYTIQDSQFLQNLYIEQGLGKYCDGNYRFAGVSNYVV